MLRALISQYNLSKLLVHIVQLLDSQWQSIYHDLVKWIQAKCEWSPYVDKIIEASCLYADRPMVTFVLQNKGVEIVLVKQAC